MSTPETRVQRRRRLHARHTTALLVMCGVLAVIALVSALQWWGILPSPFAREFSRTPTGVAAVEVACPPADAAPLPFDQLTVRVYNGSSQEGFAGNTADALKAHGITVESVGNWTETSTVPTLIISGQDGLTQAYTLARLFPDATVTTDDRSDQTVDVVLGEGGVAPLTPEAVAALPADQGFVAPQGCE